MKYLQIPEEQKKPGNFNFVFLGIIIAHVTFGAFLCMVRFPQPQRSTVFDVMDLIRCTPCRRLVKTLTQKHAR